MPASRTGTKRCSPADMSIQFKQCSACQSEVWGGLEAHRFTRLFRQSLDPRQKFLVGFSTKPLDIRLPSPRLTGVFWCLVHLNKSRDLSTSATRQLWLCFCGRKHIQKKKKRNSNLLLPCFGVHPRIIIPPLPKQIRFPWTCLHIKVLLSTKLFTFVTMIKLLPFCWLRSPASLCSLISPQFGVACLSGVWQH